MLLAAFIMKRWSQGMSVKDKNKQTKTVKSVFCIYATHSDQVVLFTQ